MRINLRILIHQKLKPLYPMKKTLRFLFIPLSCLLFLLPVSSFAGNWSDEQQSLLDHLEWTWDLWMEAIEKDDPKIWMKHADENYRYWWAAEGAPNGPRTLIRDWDIVRATDATWIDFRPIDVIIRGNVGVIHFYGYWRANTEEGPVTTEHKRTEVFVKQGGKWKLVAGHSTPVSSKDADPYK